jgi:hypothetical protein
MKNDDYKESWSQEPESRDCVSGISIHMSVSGINHQVSGIRYRPFFIDKAVSTH